MDVVIEVTDSQAFPWKIFSLLNSFLSLKMSYNRKAFNPVVRTFLQYNWSTICEMLLWHNFLAELFIDSEERKNLIRSQKFLEAFCSKLSGEDFCEY